MSDDLSPGEIVLDRYVIEAPLGEGGMGRVYLGRHQRLGMPVAVKVLFPEADAELVRRFEREAQLMARVRHPNVVAILDFGVLGDGSPCIAMEFVRGESLAARLARRGALPWQEGIPILTAILAGLDAIHQADVVHRDLKPSNVVLSHDASEVKLVDFGIARPTSATATRHTRTGAMVGTPAYMAPEQIVGAPVDARTDVYAAGLLAFEVLTGSLPFGDDAPRSAMARLSSEVPSPEAPAGLPPLPPHVVEAVRAALAFAPERRPPTALTLSQLLASASPAESWAPPPSSFAHDRTQFASGPAPIYGTSHTTRGGARASGVAPSPTTRFVIAARIPPSRLVRPDDRRWLAGLLGRGRSYALGADLWIAISSPSARVDAEAAAGKVEYEISTRYGELASIAWTVVDDTFAVTPASLTGAAPLPDPLPALLERVAS